MHMMAELDEVILKHRSGVQNKSFIQIIDTDLDENDIDEPQIIKHSPYYDFNGLVSTLNTSKTIVSIFSTNSQSINANIDQLDIFVDRLT